jgi:uncharacterized lipoprotein YddW (UPF0748 family)
MRLNSYIFLIATFVAFFQNSCTKLEVKKSINEGFRGVWITNVASQVLDSKSNIENAVALCDSLGFNNIFVVTWNNATTTFPSKTVENITGLSIQEEFKGRDPLKEIIDAAHKRNIKVHAWFEFGFSSSYLSEIGGPILRAKPHWASKDIKGNTTSKNGFQWMNPFHPEVQKFISDLVLEVVHNYDIDGIQGDDRLPALPSVGGYDPYTVALYKKENNGASPPEAFKDYEWIKWRSEKLSNFLFDLMTKLKANKPSLTISMAPSIYPWSEAEYLQDWPTWLNSGMIDFIVPQVYRYDIKKYENEILKINKFYTNRSCNYKVYPGVLLQVDTYNPSDTMLLSMVDINRKNGLDGEVYFFYEGIKKFKKQFISLNKK